MHVRRTGTQCHFAHTFCAHLRANYVHNDGTHDVHTCRAHTPTACVYNAVGVVRVRRCVSHEVSCARARARRVRARRRVCRNPVQHVGLCCHVVLQCFAIIVLMLGFKLIMFLQWSPLLANSLIGFLLDFDVALDVCICRTRSPATLHHSKSFFRQSDACACVKAALMAAMSERSATIICSWD